MTKLSEILPADICWNVIHTIEDLGLESMIEEIGIDKVIASVGIDKLEEALTKIKAKKSQKPNTIS